MSPPPPLGAIRSVLSAGVTVVTDPHLVSRTARMSYLCETIRHAERVCTRPLNANPDYRYDDDREARCRRVIAPGDRYLEYLGDVAAYQSGSRYCRVCAASVWGRPDVTPNGGA